MVNFWWPLCSYVLCKKNYDLSVLFDSNGRKGKGKFTLSTRQKEDLVEVYKLLKMDSSDDSIFRYIKMDLNWMV